MRRTKRPFPAVAYDHVLVFTDWNDSGPIMSFNSPIPVIGALTRQGTLASSTVLPGVPVKDDQVAELLELINAQPLNQVQKIRLCAGCAGPRHSYVFYDTANSPVAVFVVALRFPDWWSYPDIGHNAEYFRYMAPGFRERYSALCESIGAGLCFYHDQDYTNHVYDELVDEYPGPDTLHGRRFQQPSPLTHVPDVPLDELDALQRRTLCAWAHRSLDRPPQCWHPNDSAEHWGMSVQTPDGTEKWVGCSLAWYQCERERFDCHRKLSEVLPCEQRALNGDPGFLDPKFESIGPDAHECRAMRGCIWGYMTAQAPQ